MQKSQKISSEQEVEVQNCYYPRAIADCWAEDFWGRIRVKYFYCIKFHAIRILKRLFPFVRYSAETQLLCWANNLPHQSQFRVLAQQREAGQQNQRQLRFL
jgi:hypothetical protein